MRMESTQPCLLQPSLARKPLRKSCCIDRSQKKKLAEAKARPLPICFDDPQCGLYCNLLPPSFARPVSCSSPTSHFVIVTICASTKPNGENRAKIWLMPICSNDHIGFFCTAIDATCSHHPQSRSHWQPTPIFAERVSGGSFSTSLL